MSRYYNLTIGWLELKKNGTLACILLHWQGGGGNVSKVIVKSVGEQQQKQKQKRQTTVSLELVK